MTEKETKRMQERDAARAVRHKRRKHIVLMERIGAAFFCLALAVAIGVLIYQLTPGVQVAKQLKEADAYLETENYEDAIASCQEALEIDSTSVQAYRAMAGAYLTQEDSTSAEQVLYQGWETTQDESLLQYYCTVLLNEAVDEINNGACSLTTVEKCVSALEKDADNTDVYTLLDACYDRLFEADTENTLLCDGTEEMDCNYDTYQNMMLRLLLVYEQSPSDELQEEIWKFAVPKMAGFQLGVGHLEEYINLLTRVNTVGTNDGISELLACAEKAMEMQDVFAEAFTIFESGVFDDIREFMNSETYLSIRDAFMDGTMEYWDGTTYIPVSQEKMIFLNTEDGYRFSFADYEEGGYTTDVINVWAAKQEDDGVQRVAISYEPASEDGEYYPHTVYEFVYLYSNVKIDGAYVPQMNYRFETRTENPEGTEIVLIGDWGGEHEWTAES